ncbi:hypothetical protein NCS57_00182000 [Fusarium keratoplasticum]|uniref:Uncharacterized protein n=1 Tax=Fusarium keratoplasticum TaxID=1328300 RepID=A0ACC0RH38_9HYPO|nr:hypothetical protein NCS57_00182000 [Fusarium keratoplasticum]KAI8685137.1 hypothetical protein NCS57_00182000 [Fusarium keratoplasticum]KAI8689257.1 hypothetical protein NCS55_00182400 [Fusarium keratoplasticum]
MSSDWDRVPSDAGFDSWNDLKLAADERAKEITAELEAKRAQRDARFAAEMERKELEWAQTLRRRLAMKPMEPENGKAMGGMLPEMRPHDGGASQGFGGGDQSESPARNGQKAQQEMVKMPADQGTKANEKRKRGKQPVNGH